MAGAGASGGAFRPFGLSQQVTVSATATTMSFVVTTFGGTTLTVGSSTNYQPSVIRLENLGAAIPFLAFGGTAATTTVGVNTGLAIGGLKTEYLRVQGTPFMAFVSAGTTTLNMTFGEGHS